MPATTSFKVRPDPRPVQPSGSPSRDCIDPRFGAACVEDGCGWIYDQRDAACPKCGSKAALNIWPTLNARSAA